MHLFKVRSKTGWWWNTVYRTKSKTKNEIKKIEKKQTINSRLFDRNLSMFEDVFRYRIKLTQLSCFLSVLGVEREDKISEIATDLEGE